MAHSSNQSHFAMVPRADIPRSKFKRDFNLHTTMDAGYLVPILLDEVLPGDTFIVKDNIFGRLATPLKPVMDNMYLDTFYFFVPTRLVWDNWQKFNGEQKNPGDSTDYLVPTMTIKNVANQTIFDYFGLPTLVNRDLEINSLPLRAYNLIWNEWFRDQNLQDSLTVNTDDGPDLPADYTLQRRGKRHDYFTSCLPFPQKGPSVPIPLGLKAPVYGETMGWSADTGLPTKAQLWQLEINSGGIPTSSFAYTAANDTAMRMLSNDATNNRRIALAAKEQYASASISVAPLMQI